MKIGVIGTGYVGLVTGVMMTSLGHDVVCLDKNQEKIKILETGDPIIYEIGLAEKLQKAIKSQSIKFTSNYSDLHSLEALFICVGTPACANGAADLSHIYRAVTDAIKHVDETCLLIIKSTVPPGTCNELKLHIQKENSKIQIAANPEFLREGSAVYDFEMPDRLVFGADQEALGILKKIYKAQIEKNIPIVATDTTTAELIKYSSNSFLSVKLSFINEISNLCEKIGADIDVLSHGIGLDKRIGSLFLKAGPGYGGSCFPKDTTALLNLMQQQNTEAMVLEAAINSNQKRYGLMCDKILDVMKGAKLLTILGAAFKAGTDDVRESPAVHIIELLAKKGIKLNIYDPVAGKNFAALNIEGTNVYDDYIEACRNSEGIIVLTEWPEFQEINFEKIVPIIKSKIILDLRRIIDEKSSIKSGFKYYSLGRKH